MQPRSPVVLPLQFFGLEKNNHLSFKRPRLPDHGTVLALYLLGWIATFQWSLVVWSRRREGRKGLRRLWRRGGAGMEAAHPEARGGTLKYFLPDFGSIKGKGMDYVNIGLKHLNAHYHSEG